LALWGDKPVDVVAVIALQICVLTPEKAALGRPYKPKSIALRDQIARHLPSILSTKRQRSILIFAKPIIWGRSANIGL
jgi:hypothetical protein